MRRAMILLIALGALAVSQVAGAPAAPAVDPSYLQNMVPLCQQQDADFVKAHGDAATQFPECLYQPADGSVSIQPSRLKLGDTTTVTFTSGTYTGSSGTVQTVPYWWNYGMQPYFARRLSPTGLNQDTDTVELEPVDASACQKMYSCLMRVENYSTYPAHEGYYRLEGAYGALAGAFGLEPLEGETYGHYDINLHVGVNEPPHAIFTYGKTGDLTYALDASSSFDPDGTITEYEWTFISDDAGPEPDMVTGQHVSVTFPAPGRYDVMLRVTDDSLATDYKTQTISIPPPPGPAAPPAPPAPPPATTTGATAPPVTPPPPTPTPTPTGLSHLVGTLTTTIGPALKLGVATNPPVASTTEEITVPATARGTRAAKRTVIARGTVRVPKGSHRTITATLTSAGRALLRHHKQVKAVLVVTSTSTTGAHHTTQHTLTLHRAG